MVELTARRRKLVLAICCLSLLIVGMDNTIVNVALYSIHVDLHASLSDLQWTIDAYTLVLASLLMFSGSMADRLGRRRTFQLGLGIFTVGSLLCSLAPGLGWLVAFRAVQAIGGSMLNPVALSIIANVFTDPRERSMAIGVWGSVFGLSLGLGPVIGGLLIGSDGWRAIFWVNVPIGVAAIVLTALFVPESRGAHARRLDPVGQFLLIVLLASLTYAIIESPRQGWAAPLTLAMLAVALVALVGLLGWERRRFEPLLELRFFRSLPFAGAIVLAVCGSGAFAGFLFLNTLYLQDVRGFSALRAGLTTAPMAAAMATFAALSGRIVGRRGTRIPLVCAGVCMCAGGSMLVGLSVHTSLLWLILSYLIFAMGFGWLNAPISNTAVSGMPRSQAGVAAAIASTSRQVGSTLGVAVVGSLVNTGLTGALGPGYTHATHLGWWLVAGCGLLIAVGGLITSSRYARRTARRVAGDVAGEPAPAAA